MMPPPNLRGARILVVEDEPFIAFDLKLAIEDTGASAVGPASTVAEALDLIAAETPDGAILDVNLPDGTIEPVLEALAASGGVVVHTGVGLPPEVRAAHPNVRVFTKPTEPVVLLRHIAGKLSR
jgi:DNA-binding response OmpR family regulator